MVKEVAPPSNVEAEQAVLGSLLLDPDAILRVQGILKHPSDFYLEKHGWIYEAILRLRQQHLPVDYLTVQGELERSSKLEGTGGAAYLVALLNAVPTSIHAQHYARMVARTALYRNTLHVSTQIAEMAYEAKLEPEELTAKVAALVANLRTGDKSSFKTAYEIGMELEERLSQRFDDPTLPFGLSTGYRAIDNIMEGLEAGELTILAGRPGSGKSALALGIARNVARTHRNVAYFSLEMANSMNLLRLVCMAGGYKFNEVRGGKRWLDNGTWRKWTEDEQLEFFRKLTMAETLPIYFNDATGITTQEATAATAELLAERDVGLVIFDYLGLAGDRGESRVQQVGAISRGLKAMASTLKVPVIALAQLNRAVEGRDDKRPTLSDLRDSGDVEQDADNVWFLYRAKYYFPTEEKWKVRFPREPYPGNLAELIVGKHRNGALNTAMLFFDDEHIRFADVEKQN